MPSYPIRTESNTTPLAATDFNIGIAEQWLESARDGGGLEPVRDDYLREVISNALASCADARARLRNIIPQIPTDNP